ncbi:uncharacterized protein CMC5_071480 [Chondromyces crocatus]|uniref:Type I restriction modification DNA specificity domain-containing protein n=2 Tax=Chondromyces crocatus TaxID=52 RepID=A0A0K1EPR7_CHOCO|nr:uncharacterized protein CMC5_071480 [Chondromyces crocatus]
MAAVDAVLPRLGALGARTYQGSGSRFQNGDVLIARISPSLENGKAALVDGLPAGEVGFGSTELTVLCPRLTTPEFLYYLLKWEGVRALLIARLVGTSGRLRVPAAAWAEVLVAVPGLPEQARIARILARVDGAIAAAQALEAQLREVRSALAHELFAPTHPQRRGDELFSLGGGYSPSAVQVDPCGDTLFLKVEDLAHPENRWGVRTASLRFRAKEHPSIRTFAPGHLVFPKRGGAIAKNRVRVLLRDAAVDPNLMVLAPGPLLDPHYFAELLQHRGLSSFAYDAGIPQINHHHLYPVRFAVPPRELQRALGHALTTFDQRLELEQSWQEALLELRSVLMTALFTGQLRASVIEALPLRE